MSFSLENSSFIYLAVLCLLPLNDKNEFVGKRMWEEFYLFILALLQYKRLPTDGMSTLLSFCIVSNTCWLTNTVKLRPSTRSTFDLSTLPQYMKTNSPISPLWVEVVLMYSVWKNEWCWSYWSSGWLKATRPHEVTREVFCTAKSSSRKKKCSTEFDKLIYLYRYVTFNLG